MIGCCGQEERLGLDLTFCFCWWADLEKRIKKKERNFDLGLTMD